MKKSSGKTADNLIMAILIHVYIGWGLLFIIKFGVNHLTYNAYMGLIPAIIIILPFFWMASDLAKLFPGLSLSAIFIRVFGMFFGKVAAAVFWLYIIFFMFIAMRFGELMVYSYFFRRMPFLLFSAVFIAAVSYPALKGIYSIGRLAGFLLIPPLIVIYILEFMGLVNVNFFNIRPVIPTSWSQWFVSGMDLTLILVPATSIFYYSHRMERPRNMVKMSLIALGTVVPMFFLTLFGTIGVFGPSETKMMSWSVVEYFHILDYPYLLLEQAGLFFLIAWYAMFFVSMAQGFYLIGDQYHIIFPRIPRNWFIAGLAAVTLLAVNLPLNVIYLESFMHKYQKWIGFSLLTVLFGTWLIARLRLGSRGMNRR